MAAKLFAPFMCCLAPRSKSPAKPHYLEPSYEPKYTDAQPGSPEDINIAADDFITTLRNANSSVPQLRKRLNADFATSSWSESLATTILSRLEDLLRSGAALGETLKVALEKAVLEAVDFAKEHPVYTTLIALGILVQIAPWVLSWLGFAALGPVEGKSLHHVCHIEAVIANAFAGSFAALWMARYAGYVPKGSLFSFFQRLGMIWK